LGQALTSLNLDLNWMREKVAAQPDRRLCSILEKRMESMGALLDSMVKSVQRISSDLRPAMLDDLGLAATLEWQAEEFARRTHIRCRWWRKPQPVALDRGRATGLFRIFQEILT